MELSVLVQPVEGKGYRATSGDPFPAVAEGATRDEALLNLRQLVEPQVGRGAEVVRLRVGWPPEKPLWPDDELTRAWLAEIEAIRAAADLAPDPWDNLPEEGAA